MKHFGLLCTFLILVGFSTSIPRYENCPKNIVEDNSINDCVKVKCYSEKIGNNSSQFRKIMLELQVCDQIQCEIGTQINYHHGDETKEYPACCSYPICKE